MSDERVIPYAHVDETVASASKGVAYKVLQTPGRLFWAGVMAGILIGCGYWLAYMTGSGFWPLRVIFSSSGIKIEHVAALLGFAKVAQYHVDLLPIAKLLIGAVFPLGLIAILIGGAELWTSCPQLVSYGYMTRRFGLKHLLYNWVAAYSGNWVGGFLLAFMATFGTAMLLKTPFFDLSFIFAYKKVHMDAWTAFWRGVGCNFLVNLAVWLWLRAKGKDFAGQVLLIWFPIFAFVAIGFEHSIANQFAIPAGMMASTIKYGHVLITYRDFFFTNLLPVTYGNLIGALAFIAMYYWYLGSVKGSKLGEVTPAAALKTALEIAVVAAVVFLALEVVVPGAIATAVEAALGLNTMASVSNPWIVLIPGIVTAVYYVAVTFIIFKVVNPLKDAEKILGS